VSHAAHDLATKCRSAASCRKPYDCNRSRIQLAPRATARFDTHRYEGPRNPAESALMVSSRRHDTIRAEQNRSEGRRASVYSARLELRRRCATAASRQRHRRHTARMRCVGTMSFDRRGEVCRGPHPMASFEPLLRHTGERGLIVKVFHADRTASKRACPRAVMDPQSGKTRRVRDTARRPSCCRVVRSSRTDSDCIVPSRK